MTRAERRASDERIARAKEETRAIVSSGCCPKCGGALRRNLALTGWWQCEQYGAPPFRARPEAESCSWQGFV